ncbi:MAG: alkaline phosphatase D family protein [Bacteroidetes bacterium]|nr:alkaline phosphatase D family protein [Bacteroidota bacterium]
MWGRKQIEWLKDELRQSSASFKFIVSGGQMTTQSREKSGETLYHYRDEYDSLMHFIQREKIPGVIFISGDIHSSEILKQQIPGMYPLYEYTCSALTSPPYAGFHNKEAIEGFRTIKNNYGKIRIVGEANKRICIFENYDIHGKLLWRYHISQEELK